MRVPLTEVRWKDIVAVNRHINRTIRLERNHAGVMKEEWILSPQVGDCNDYSVTKRHELLARGWPSSILLLSEVVTSWGEHHLVLVVRVEEGDLILDNLDDNVRLVGSTLYRWVRAQSPINPLFWSNVKVPGTSRAHSHRVQHSR
jgi:predicted transglutaminase-like cysteine proteinase